MRADYAPVRPPGKGSGVAPVPAPMVPIRARAPRAEVLPGSLNAVKGAGLIDAGANVSVVPLWAAPELGIAVGEGGRQPSLGAGGGFDSYSIGAGIHARIGGRWLDIGVVKALSPDTETSRRKGSSLPFLLGRDGLFDKFTACFGGQDRTTWVRRKGESGGGRRSQGGAQGGPAVGTAWRNV